MDFTFARLTNTSGRAELKFNQSFLNDFGIAAEESPPNSRGRFLQSRSPLDVTMKITRTTPVAMVGPGGLCSPRHHTYFRPSFLDFNCSP